jgi:hypothetical protein
MVHVFTNTLTNGDPSIEQIEQEWKENLSCHKLQNISGHEKIAIYYWRVHLHIFLEIQRWTSI